MSEIVQVWAEPGVANPVRGVIGPDDPSLVAGGVDMPLASEYTTRSTGQKNVKFGSAPSDWAKLAATSGFLPLSGGNLNPGANLGVPGTLVVGTDPGGSSTLRVGGALRVNGAIELGLAGANLQGRTTGGVLVNLFALTSNIARSMAGIDAGGFQWTDQAQSAQWMALLSSGLTVNGTINSGAIYPTGQNLAKGASAGWMIEDRTDSAKQYGFYASGGFARLWSSTYGDVANFTWATAAWTFLGAVVVNGALTGGTVTSKAQIYSGQTGSGTGGQVHFLDDGGVDHWVLGIPGTVAGRNFFLYDITRGVAVWSADPTTGVVTFNSSVLAGQFESNDGSFKSGSGHGSLELGPNISSTATPFIDFHFGIGSTQDYNVRLINDANGLLSLVGALSVTDRVIAHKNVEVNVDGRGYGLLGVYDPTKYRAIYSMGTGYEMATAGATLGTLYGLFFGYEDGTVNYPNISGGFGLGHGMGLAANGVSVAFLGSSGFWHLGSGRFGGALTVAGSMTVTGTFFVNGTIKRPESASAGFYNDSTSTGYSGAALLLRERALGNSISFLAPRIAFHWSGVVASQINIESNGTIAILDNPGTGYEKFRAGYIWAMAGARVEGAALVIERPGGNPHIQFPVAGNADIWLSHASGALRIINAAYSLGVFTVTNAGNVDMTGTLAAGGKASLNAGLDLYAAYGLKWPLYDGGLYADVTYTYLGKYSSVAGLKVAHATGAITVTPSIRSPQFIDNLTGANLVPVIVSGNAPSGTAPTGTLWIRF